MALLLGPVLGYALLLLLAPGWFEHWPLISDYRRILKPWYQLGPAAWWPFALAVGLLVLSLGRRHPTGLLLLTGACIGLQWGCGWLEGRRAGRLSETLLHPHFGHSEFVPLAAPHLPLLEMGRSYEQLCATRTEFRYARSKPPGQLLFYACSTKLMEGLGLGPTCRRLATPLGCLVRDPFTAFGAFACLLFPLLAALPVLVLGWLGRRCAGAGVGLLAGLAFALMPSTSLVTMHLDQVLYPLLTAGVLALAHLAVARPVWALACGALIYLACFVSFSLLFLVPTVLLWWLAALLPAADRSARGARLVAWGAGGLLLAGGLLGALFHYQPWVAYPRAMEHHVQWRATRGLVGVGDSTRNLVEFAIWVGLPTTVLVLLALGRALRRATRDPLDRFLLGYPLILLAVCVFGHTVREIGRLWIPLAVPLLIPAARELHRRAPRPWLYATSGLLMVLLVKTFQDFQ